MLQNYKILNFLKNQKIILLTIGLFSLTSCVETIVISTGVGAGLAYREKTIDDTRDDLKIATKIGLNFISKGKVTVVTEFGQKHLEAPCTFVSEIGLKRAVYAEEDTLWTTVHLTEHGHEDDLSKIEDEVIAPSYENLGLIDSVEKLLKLRKE